MSVRNVTPVPSDIETYKQKFVRRFKEEPLVPIGAAATCVALVAAIVKSRRGDPKSMNHWLRARVVLQGLTIVAIVGGSYALGNTKQQKEARAASEQDEVLASAAKERVEFQERLKAAEDAYNMEEEMASGGKGVNQPVQDGQTGSGWWGWSGGGKNGGEQGVSSSKSGETPLPPPPRVSSAPAGAEMIRSPVADAAAPSSKGFWERLGWSSSSGSGDKS